MINQITEKLPQKLLLRRNILNFGKYLHTKMAFSIMEFSQKLGVNQKKQLTLFPETQTFMNSLKIYCAIVECKLYWKPSINASNKTQQFSQKLRRRN